MLGYGRACSLLLVHVLVKIDIVLPLIVEPCLVRGGLGRHSAGDEGRVGIISVVHDVVVLQLLPFVEGLVDASGERLRIHVRLTVASRLHQALSEFALKAVHIGISDHIFEELHEGGIGPLLAVGVFEGACNVQLAHDQVPGVEGHTSEHVVGVELVLHGEEVEVGVLL
mmetsp:Transcript_5756/g.6305  ORF Transcript_5756/g.6305 Transcript_5756/m.6305 type:complete len:169 (-) Transcript_5756:956-1462(-)